MSLLFFIVMFSTSTSFAIEYLYAMFIRQRIGAFPSDRQTIS